MKKALSILLAIILAFSTSVLAFARGVTEEERTCPYVYVHGFMAKDIYVDWQDETNDDLVWPPSSDDILEVVKECLPDLLSFLVTKNYDALTQALLEPCKKLLSSANLGYDGNIADKSGIRFKYPDPNKITKESELSFGYDWRLDPYEVAEQLNDYIEYVCKYSGCDQVVLECHSFGGVIVTSYITRFTDKRVKGVVMNSTAIYGETYTGEMLSGNIVLNADSLSEFLKCMLSENEYSKLINGLFDLLNAQGITDSICELGNNIVKYCGTDLIREVVAPMFAGWLSIWSMIPDEYIDDCMDYVFNDVYANDGIDHSGLKAKITRYNTEIRATKTQTLIKLNEDANVYVYCRYGYSSVPLSKSWKNMSDSVIDVKYASMGATAANYGNKLPADYLKEREGSKYIGPLKNIDASTCMFPNQTWFIRNMNHSENSDGMDSMSLDLLYYDGQATVNTFEQYPQWLKFDSENDTVIPDDGYTGEAENIFDKIFKYFIMIIADLRGIHDFFFGIFK